MSMSCGMRMNIKSIDIVKNKVNRPCDRQSLIVIIFSRGDMMTGVLLFETHQSHLFIGLVFCRQFVATLVYRSSDTAYKYKYEYPQCRNVSGPSSFEVTLKATKTNCQHSTTQTGWFDRRIVSV